MKRYCFITLLILVSFYLISCAPVIRRDLMNVAIRDMSLYDIKRNPELYKGKLFVLGGIIVNTKATNEGSLIEAIYVPVDSRGYLKGVRSPNSRFLALFPKENGFLDPMIFRREREITIAGEFTGVRQGKIDEMDYVYPFFKIKELYLWEERKDYYVLPPYYEPYPYWWDYPYWWNHPYWWRNRVLPYYW